MPPNIDEIRREAGAIAGTIGREDREQLLIRCWMSHDARWYMAVARSYGLEAANQLNRQAAHDEGVAEARRVLRATGQGSPQTLAECLRAQQVIAGLLTPGLADYQLDIIGDDTFSFSVDRCFAYENVTRARVAEQYECGIFARVAGWWDAFEVDYEMRPQPGRCLKVLGKDCRYVFSLQAEANG